MATNNEREAVVPVMGKLTTPYRGGYTDGDRTGLLEQQRLNKATKASTRHLERTRRTHPERSRQRSTRLEHTIYDKRRDGTKIAYEEHSRCGTRTPYSHNHGLPGLNHKRQEKTKTKLLLCGHTKKPIPHLRRG